MMDPPTDRLHKFLAVGGLLLIALGVTYPLQKYEAAELARIEAYDRMQLFAQSYGRYAETVNEQIALYNDAQKSGGDPEAIRKAKQGIIDLEPEVAPLERETSNAQVEATRNIQLLQHYHLMRNLWLVIGALLVLAGIAASTYGFRQWLKQPKRSR